LSLCQGDDTSITDLTIEVKVNRVDTDTERKSPNQSAQKLRDAASKANDEVVPQSSAEENLRVQDSANDDVNSHVDIELDVSDEEGVLETDLKHARSAENTASALQDILLRVRFNCFHYKNMTKVVCTFTFI